MAIGSAYKFCIDRYRSMSEQELKSIGFNESSAHTDMMISDKNTSVYAILRDGTEIILIKNGEWTSYPSTNNRASTTQRVLGSYGNLPF